MKTHEVSITEFLNRVVRVSANTKEDAEIIAEEEWYKGKHILTEEDFVSVEFNAN